MRSFLYLMILSLLAASVILAIFHYGDLPNRRKNGFKRSYFQGAYSGWQERKLRDTLYDIVGVTPWTIYISTATEGEVLEVGKDLKGKIKRIRIPFFARWYDSLQFSSLSIRIDSPHIYLFAENKPAIVKTNFDSTSFEFRILPPGAFSREVMAGPDCFILRKLEHRLTDQLFVRYNFSTGLLKKEVNISETYGDGGIISDGQLHFDDSTKKLYYIYYYKNLVLSFDTSLASANKFASIDTTTSFKMKTGLVENSGTRAFTNITPANIINRLNYVQNGLLFNMSALKADNETDQFFSDHSVIDIIDLKNGKYLRSMSLPLSNGARLSQFVISGNKLVGLYPNSIIIYDLSLELGRQGQ
ncbi:MAG TPA: hypothetical protein VK518_05675 [Puia sp.]|nr:hypothetical protein [Puia sp.]